MDISKKLSRGGKPDQAIENLKNTLAREKNEDFKDQIVSSIYFKAEEIARDVVSIDEASSKKLDWDRRLDDILTSKYTGFPIMFILLGIIFWITIVGSNVPSEILSKLFFTMEAYLTKGMMAIRTPYWLHGLLVLGVYRTLAWVVSVMLPPMAIFFPLFTFLEDLGYLPRVAFNLDRLFKRAGSHGKQSLTMSMGFGCNAAGVVACRIIESPRERLIAMVTNNFVPCNGRFPTLIALSSIFLTSLVASKYINLTASLLVSILVLVGIGVTLLVSWLLSKTWLKGVPSSFTLELPPYRRPQLGRILYTSLIDRTIFVLGRAIVVAAPAGLIIWFLANVSIGASSILSHCAGFLQPFANLIGLDGFILMAFILGLPANEIVLPILIMSYMSQGAMLELDSIQAMRQLFLANGWTWLTMLNFILFTLFHFPCGTTLWTIKKESGSSKWTLLSALIPTVAGLVILFTITQLVRLFGLV